MLSVTCPSCQRSGRIQEQHSGRQVKCPRCGETFTCGGDLFLPSSAGRAPRRRQHSRSWGTVTVVVFAILATGAGGFLLAQLLSAGTEQPPAGPPTKVVAKGLEPVARKAGSQKVAAPEQRPTDSTKAVPKEPSPTAPKGVPTEIDSLDWRAGSPLVLSKLDQQLERYHTLIKPQPGEWKFARIPWVRTVWEARKKAADEGKPMFIWYMAGEPLGQC